MKVSELANEVGTSSDALRYYERIGLLTPPPRTASGYRMYDQEAVERVRFIKRAQRFGLRLADIADLVAIQERGMCPCGGTRRLLEARMTELDDEMEALRRLRREIEAMLEDERSGEGAGVSQCGPVCAGGVEEASPDEPIRTIVALRPTRNGRDHTQGE